MAFAEELAEGLTRGAITALIDRRDVLVPFAAAVTQAIGEAWRKAFEGQAVDAKPPPETPDVLNAIKDAMDHPLPGSGD